MKRKLLIRWAWVLAIAVIATGAALGTAVSFASGRSALARVAVGGYLWTKGFRLEHVDLSIGNGLLDARQLVVTDDSRGQFFTADRIDVAYGAAARAFGISSLRIERPNLTIARLPDGSYNISRLFGGSGNQGLRRPFHLSLRVTDGAVEVLNPSSPSERGRGVLVDKINVRGILNEGMASTGSFAGVLRADGRGTPIDATYSQNDTSKVARAVVHVTGAPIAAVIDLLVSSPAFVVERGVLDAKIDAYAVAWNPALGPRWHIAGVGQVRNGRLRLVPLARPLTDINGPIRLADGLLIFPALAASEAGITVRGFGTIHLLGNQNDPSLGLYANAAGPLARLRSWLPFSARLPLEGTASAAVTIRGTAASPHVDVELASKNALRYGRVPIDALRASLYYAGKHVAVRSAFAAYNGSPIYAHGDIDLTSPQPAGQFVVTTIAPTRTLPLFANVDATGTTRIEAAFFGPLSRLSGSGFACAFGGDTRIQAALSAAPERLASTALFTDSRGGDLLTAGELSRTSDGVLNADVFARHFYMRMNGRSVLLPGLARMRINVPSAAGRLDGYAVLRGSTNAPDAAVLLRADHAVFEGLRLGRIVVGADGAAARFQVERVAVRGQDMQADATGTFFLRSSTPGAANTIVGTVGGNAALDLNRIARLLHGTTAAGRFSAGFSAVSAGNGWLAEISSSGSSVSLGGVPIGKVDAAVGSSGGRITVYGATARAAGGEIAALGILPNAHGGDLTIVARHVEASSLQRGDVPLARGDISVAGHIRGTSVRPSVTGAIVLVGGEAAGHPIAGDAQVHYAGGRLRADDARVVIDDSLVNVDGTISGLNSGGVHAPTVSLDATMPVGNLATLSAALLPQSATISGTASARVRVDGPMSGPHVTGQITADAGAVRGVPFAALGVTFAAQPGAVDVPYGSVRFGSSRLNVAGAVTPGSVDVHAASGSVNLDDFNGFFDGKDVLDGIGSFNLSVDSDPNRVNGTGSLRLKEARVAQVPLGSIDARLAPLADGVGVDFRQRGILGSTTVKGRVALAQLGEPPTVTARAELRHLNLGSLARYAGASQYGIAGSGSATVLVSGRAGNLASRVDFTVADGRINDRQIRQLRGTIDADKRALSLRSLRMAVDGGEVDAHGRISREGIVTARAVATIDDLGKIAHLARKPISAQGRAVVNLEAAGSLADPRLRAQFSADHGKIADVGYDRVGLDATYKAKTLALAGAADFAGGLGSLRLTGALPVRLSPFAIGPNNKALALELDALHVGLAVLNPLLSDKVQLAGSVDGHAAIRGTAGHPHVFGSAQFINGSLHSRVETVPVTNLNGSIAFQHDAITIHGMHGNLGNGSVDLSGAAHIVPATVLRSAPSLQYYARAAMRQAQVDVPNYVKGSIEASLTLTKSGAVPYLAGSIGLTDTSVPFASILALASSSGGNGIAKPGETVPGLPTLRHRHIIAYGGSIFGDASHVISETSAPRSAVLAIVPPAVDLGLTVNAGKNVGVRGVVDVTGTGSVAIGGSSTAPALDGTLTAVRGRAGFLNTRFQLSNGALTFDPADGLLPLIDAQATTSTDAADITVSISGRVDHLHTDLSSNPEMSRDAILATLLRVPQINSALASAQGQPQSTLGASPADVVSGVAAGQLLGAFNVGLEQFLNLQEVDFSIGSNGRPMLEVRKQVGQRIYSLYRTTFDIPPAQAFGLDYVVRRAIDIQLTQSQSTPGLNPTFAPQQVALAVKISFH